MENIIKNTRTIYTTNADLQKMSRNTIIHSTTSVGDGKVLANITTYNIIITYDKIVELLIKKRYTIEQEICLTNKGIVDLTNEEYRAYRAYVEECKTNARQFLEERYQALGV